MIDKYFLLPLKIRRNIKEQVTAIKLAVNNSIPLGVDRACIILALSELIQDYTELEIQQNHRN